MAYFSDSMLLTGLQKQIAKFVKRKLKGRSEKFCEVPHRCFRISVLSFILNFEVSDQGFEIKRGVGGGGAFEPFWLYITNIFGLFL